MTTTTSNSNDHRSPFGDGTVSRYELVLLLGAAVMLAAAYPIKHGTVPPTPLAGEPETQLLLEIKTELEANASGITPAVTIVPASTTVRLGPVEGELIAEGTDNGPAS